MASRPLQPANLNRGKKDKQDKEHVLSSRDILEPIYIKDTTQSGGSGMGAAPTAAEAFCSYAHEDEVWRQKLETHLSLLRRQGLVSFWHNRLITPGTDWAQAIDSHLETASIILLLVSADFFASDYCYGIEMQHALKRHETGEARVIPLLVRLVDWKNAPFAHLQCLPTDARPLSIWQDEDMALTDVATGIRRVLEDLPLLAASAPRAALPAIWNIPYSRNPFFLGRESELAQVRQRLQAGQTMALSQPQAISGLGGIGKTQVALEYAYRYHHDYQAVLWVHAESTKALISSYLAIASLLQLPEREAAEQDITVQAVKTWLQIHGNWLLILDNANELALLPDFLPTSPGGHLMLTTRAIATGRLAQRLEIETLPPEQGALLLLRRAGIIAPDAELAHASDEEQEQAKRLTLELGGLPLALDQAGAYLEETGTDLASYWLLYQEHRADLLQRRGGLVSDHPAHVAMTFSLCFEQVEARNPAAADLLRLLTFLAPDAIPEKILTESASLLGPVLAPVAANAFLLNQAIEVLRAYSLVQRDSREKTLSIHRLVQAVLQDTLETTEKRTWAERALLAVNAAFPVIERSSWRLRLQSSAEMHFDEVYQTLVEESMYLHDNTMMYLRNHARYIGEEAIAQQVLQIFIQGPGSNHPDVAASLHWLARLYYEQGKYSEAEQLYQRALHIREQQLGPDHPDVAASLQGLAILYQELGRFKEAELLYQRTLHIVELQLGSEHPLVAYPLNNLAILYKEYGKYTEAEPLFQRALHIWEQQLVPEHPLVAYLLNNLADLYHNQGRYDEAELLYQRALLVREQQLGPSHPGVAASLHGLAMLYHNQGRYAEAEPLYQHALTIREQHLGSQHPQVAETMHELAQLREAQGNSEEARALYAYALAIREQALGARHPKTAETRKSLIALLHALGQHEEAAKFEVAQTES
jgi:tetratricopeptide (TPR) repeat protein